MYLINANGCMLPKFVFEMFKKSNVGRKFWKLGMGEVVMWANWGSL
jgi:hypothetical protein